MESRQIKSSYYTDISKPKIQQKYIYPFLLDHSLYNVFYMHISSVSKFVNKETNSITLLSY